ncbi:MAG: molybdopterin-synthase adenylyltransferase MoeB [Nitrospinae bacterium]|nr:molybdopterin-synthase adenylyltransferase MoeB [Nitrospinota bacterium]MBF0633394.1 molybdopterin-synthase adenylyltransferase MoeB [Nitrospinota bacterium]
MNFTEEQIYRYSRHIILPEVGGGGQEKLLKARVLCLGAGGLGSPALMYLAAAGVGNIGIVDFDKVDFSNLQRQIIHNTEKIGVLKVESAKQFINNLNPDVKVTAINERLSSSNVMDIFKDYDIIVDGCDNFPTRYLVNDACILLNKTNVHGSIFRFDGQVTVFKPKEGPCYRCLYPEPPPPGMVPSCQEAGVLGVLPGVVGTLQAVEVIKLIIGKGQPLVGKLLLYNALNAEVRKLNIRRDANCPMCGDTPTITGLIDYDQFCGIPAGGGH